ncbi:DUF4358 domain-containing protein [Caproiciproducens sp. MSJ-32]|uniref:DUF4358 domain-containing protein n=1 Tax=Caproiciproducens sp. MSJ-32 TaxID=2841527 RepID=UPI002570E7F6|nr:DUF4358 domain-containing protein [Caproiciproducens sp. MSJ-32]
MTLQLDHIFAADEIYLEILLFTLSLSFVGCTGEKAASGNSTIDESLENIMTKLYDDLDEDLGELVTTELTKENLSYYLGINELDFEEGLASEPMLSTSAHSVVLVRVKDSVDIEKIKNDIKENVDPFKWVCVGVEKDKIVVENIGNLILLVMDNNYSEDFKNIFLSLKN